MIRSATEKTNEFSTSDVCPRRENNILKREAGILKEPIRIPAGTLKRRLIVRCGSKGVKLAASISRSEHMLSGLPPIATAKRT
jgi:hypothetical protein